MSGDFDKATDRAVREMLDVEPPAGMRARVLQRIDPGASAFSRKVRFGSKFPWIAAPIAAAAMIALAVLLPQRGAQTPETVARVETPPVVAPAPHQPATSAPAPNTGAASAPGQPSSAPRNVAGRRPRTTTAPDRIVAGAAFTPDESTTEIAPLTSITPIEMEPLTEHRVATAAISVRPLTPITEVQIAPLNPPDRRD